MISNGNHVNLARLVLLAVIEEAETWLPSFCAQCVIKQLLDSVFVISRIIKVSVISTVISNSNRTEWSPIQSVIIRVITKSDDRAAGVRFVYHEYDYRLNWTTRSPIIN